MNDPRTMPDFRPELYPRLEGKLAPVAAEESDKNLQRKLEVLAAYYQVNVCYQRVLEARKAENENPSPMKPPPSSALRAPSPRRTGRRNSLHNHAGPTGRRDAERLALQELERALLARDRLDDEFAAFGTVSSPEVKNGIITNVTFTGVRKEEPTYSTISMCFAVAPL